MRIGDKIRQLRQENHMTQETLARRLNISAQAVSKWEQNVTAPDISLLAEIADCFQITTDELLGAGRYKTASGYKTYRARLAAVYEEGGTEEDFEKAAAAYEDVLLRGEPSAEDYMMYGYLYNVRVRRDMEMAMRYYEKALAAGAETRDACWFKTHQQITLLLCMQRRGDEAVTRWKDWLAQEPDNVQALLSVIWALLHADRAKEALPYMEQAERLAPEDPYVLYAIGDVLGGDKGLGRYEEAIGYWDRALALRDDFADCFYSKAYAYEQLGQYEKAIEVYQQLCRWLEQRGFDLGVEAQYPEERIRALMEKLDRVERNKSFSTLA